MALFDKILGQTCGQMNFSRSTKNMAKAVFASSNPHVKLSLEVK